MWALSLSLFLSSKLLLKTLKLKNMRSKLSGGGGGGNFNFSRHFANLDQLCGALLKLKLFGFLPSLPPALNTLATVVSIEHTHTHTLSIIDSGFKFKAVLQLLLMAHSLYPT